MVWSSSTATPAGVALEYYIFTGVAVAITVWRTRGSPSLQLSTPVRPLTRRCGSRLTAGSGLNSQGALCLLIICTVICPAAAEHITAERTLAPIEPCTERCIAQALGQTDKPCITGEGIPLLLQRGSQCLSPRRQSPEGGSDCRKHSMSLGSQAQALSWNVGGLSKTILGLSFKSGYIIKLHRTSPFFKKHIGNSQISSLFLATMLFTRVPFITDVRVAQS